MRKKYCLSGLPILFLLSLITNYSIGQTFNNLQQSNIPDNDIIDYPISVTGITSQIDTTQFGLQSVFFDIEHEDNSHLTIYLESPGGKSILLLKSLPGKNFSGTEINGTSSRYIDFGENSYSENYRSIQDLALINNFTNPNGQWKLVVKDDKSGGVGRIKSAGLHFSNNPAKPILSTSNLPIVIINTNDVEINNHTKLLSDMKIIYNGEGKLNSINDPNTHFDGKIGIKIRGSSSQAFPKKQYGFDTMEEDGKEDIKVSLLEMPKGSDWVLSAIYQDKTMMRNPLTYQLAREMGSYAARTNYCEVIINDEYRGVFVLQEKIERDKNRVDIEKLSETDIAEPNVSGGYILELDRPKDEDIFWTSKIPAPTGVATIFIYNYPDKAKDLQPEQKNYIESYIHSFEESLLESTFTDPENGYRKYIDENSFIDYFIVNELSNNIDGYRKSSYFYKNRQGKLTAGPVWDYDLAWGNANYFGGELSTGFRYSYSYPEYDLRIPFWWPRMMEDPVWKLNMNCRYRNLRNTVLSQAHIFEVIDSLNKAIDQGQERNFVRWNILGKYVNPNPSPILPDYLSEVERLKLFVRERLNFLDANLGICSPLNITLFDFNAKKLRKSVQLNWEAMFDEQTEVIFEIERSANAGIFIKIGEIEKKNIIKREKNKFQFLDPDPPSGMNIYRLRMVNKNGQISYSKSIPIEFVIPGWTLHPNEISTTLVLKSPLRGRELVKLNIYNTNGQLLKTASLPNNAVLRYDVDNLPKGFYLLEVIYADHNRDLLKFTKK